MRKLGIVIALTAAATLGSFGLAGSASAQEQAPLCDAVEQVTQPVVDGGLPVDDTQNGVVTDCMTSGAPIAGTGINVNNTLCGLEKDLGEVIDPQLGGAVGSIHGTVDDIEDQAEAAGLPNIVNLNHPCSATPDGGGGNGGAGGGGGGNNPGPASVQAANATSDGSLPRTGAELFAGAGFALMSLGALVRRFLS